MSVKIKPFSLEILIQEVGMVLSRVPVLTHIIGSNGQAFRLDDGLQQKSSLL